MDIIFETVSLTRTRFKSATPKGFLWIRENMAHDEVFQVVVDTEFLNELKENMRKDGLIVD